MSPEKHYEKPDLTAYHPYGFPMLKFLGAVALLPLIATLLYKFFF